MPELVKPKIVLKPNLIHKATEFIEWLERNTDFGDWDGGIRAEVHQKLIAILISEEK